MVTGLLTLTTDFGTRDGYVAAMKGVILSICPSARMVDVTHDVPPQDLMEAGFVLRSIVPTYPEGTVHLIVVDPGVGSSRKLVAAYSGGQYFVCPDNGLLSLVLNGQVPEEIVELDRPAFWRSGRISNTFHGRDIFAPVAAHLACGRSLSEVGSPLRQLSPMHWALPISDSQGIRGWVVHIDRFGNCITNIPRTLVEEQRDGRAVRCYAGSAISAGIQRSYSDVEIGEPVALYGSDDFLELSVNGGNASELFGIRRGAAVSVVFQDRR